MGRTRYDLYFAPPHQGFLCLCVCVCIYIYGMRCYAMPYFANALIAMPHFANALIVGRWILIQRPTHILPPPTCPPSRSPLAAAQVVMWGGANSRVVGRVVGRERAGGMCVDLFYN